MKPKSYSKTVWEESTLSFDTTPKLGLTDSLASVAAIVVEDEDGVDHYSEMVSGLPAMVGNIIYVKFIGGILGSSYKGRVRGVSAAGEKIEDFFTLVIIG